MVEEGGLRSLRVDALPTQPVAPPSLTDDEAIRIAIQRIEDQVRTYPRMDEAFDSGAIRYKPLTTWVQMTHPNGGSGGEYLVRWETTILVIRCYIAVYTGDYYLMGPQPTVFIVDVNASSGKVEYVAVRSLETSEEEYIDSIWE